jgi:hypothetical protein
MAVSLLDACLSPTSAERAGSRARTIGLTLGFVGVALALVTLIDAIAAGTLAGRTGEGTTVARLLAWSFGLTTTAFGTLKVAIAVILVGILARLWLRVAAVKEALPSLKPGSGGAAPEVGTAVTPYGRATVSAEAPRPLFIHRMVRALWAPMLTMGAMAVLAGFVLSWIVAADTIGTDAALARSQQAWVQGLQFLGEGFLLSGISFLLGTILGSLRKGGGEVQASAGVAVKTLAMPVTAKLFVGLMALGLMVEVFQFVAYVVVATFADPARVATAFAWLGPVREAGLGILLSGIVLALATIAKALGFQFWRLSEIVSRGR